MQKENPSSDEKRTLVDIIAIKEAIPRENVRWVWVPTHEIVTDGLTN